MITSARVAVFILACITYFCLLPSRCDASLVHIYHKFRTKSKLIDQRQADVVSSQGVPRLWEPHEELPKLEPEKVQVIRAPQEPTNAHGLPKGASVAVINCPRYHFEILMGFVQVLHGLDANITVYLQLGLLRSQRVMALMRHMHPSIQFCNCSLEEAASAAHAQLVVLVSAQEEITIKSAAFDIVRAINPKAILAVQHKAGNESRDKMDQVMALHPNTYMMALAPNPGKLLRKTLADKFQTRPDLFGWILPIYDFNPVQPCDEQTPSCLYRFTVQGRLEKRRRNYPRLFGALAATRPDPRMHVQLVGDFSHASPMEVPIRLQHIVSLRPNLPFQVYYEVIHHSVALVPLFAKKDYINGGKISSTVVAALICKVPMILTQEILDAYTFLTREASYMQRDDEVEVDAMNRVMQMSPKEHMKKRRALDEIIGAQRQRAELIIRHILETHTLPAYT